MATFENKYDCKITLSKFEKNGNILNEIESGFYKICVLKALV
jgi:hypothetical protein